MRNFVLPDIGEGLVVLTSVGDKKELSAKTFCYRFEHCDNKKDKKVVAQEIFHIFVLSLQF